MTTTGRTSAAGGVLGDAQVRAKQRFERRAPRRVRPLRQRWLVLVAAVLLVAPLLGLVPPGPASAEPVEAPKPMTGEPPAAASGGPRPPLGAREMHAVGEAAVGPQVFPALSPREAQNRGEPDDSQGLYAGSENDAPAPGVAAPAGQEFEHKWDRSHPLPQGNQLTDVHIPEPWRGRAMGVALIPLLPDEVAAVLAGRPASPVLDERDEEIARLLTTGASLAEMGRAVGLSPRGVQHRLAALRRRFGARTTTELAAYLARHGIGMARKGNDPPQES